MQILDFLIRLILTLLRRKVSGHLPDPDDDAVNISEAHPPLAPVVGEVVAPAVVAEGSQPAITAVVRGALVEVPAAPVPPTDPRWSPLATKVGGARNPRDAKPRKPWGLLLHTTGGGVTKKAKKVSRSPVSVAIDIYIASQNGHNDGGYLWGGPHYVLDHDGHIYQVAPDNVVTSHAGGPDRKAYTSGAWTKQLAQKALDAWRAKWPGFASPPNLYPTTSPNTAYIGVEMIPCGDGFGEPAYPDCRFTAAQIATVIALGRDCATRHGWPADWATTPRLLGHEDVQPLRRSTIAGCWDPGFVRPGTPWFPFGAVRLALAPAAKP